MCSVDFSNTISAPCSPIILKSAEMVVMPFKIICLIGEFAEALQAHLKLWDQWTEERIAAGATTCSIAQNLARRLILSREITIFLLSSNNGTLTFI